MPPEKQPADKQKPPGIFSLLKPYGGLVALLLLFAVLSNGINLLLPKLIAGGIDAYTHKNFDVKQLITEFSLAVGLIFIFGYLQSVIQTYASERVARDLRTKLSDKISKQSHAFIEKANPSKLLTNLTADTDSIKLFVSQAIVSIASSLFIIVGASILLLTINWRLALTVIAIIPIIGGTFFYVLKKVRALFIQSRQVIDWLNKIINESILGAALIRVINSQNLETAKFLEANTKARDFGLSILNMFAGLIPVITFTANLSALTILALGGV
jgi:ATP-binding cassette subfamily B protein